MLFLFRASRSAWHPGHVQNHRLVRRFRGCVVTELHRPAQVDPGVVHPRSGRVPDAQVREGRPLTDEDVRVDDGHLDAIHERRPLLVGHLGDEVGDDPVVARHHTVIRPYLLGLVSAHIRDLDLAGCVRIA